MATELIQVGKVREKGAGGGNADRRREGHEQCHK